MPLSMRNGVDNKSVPCTLNVFETAEAEAGQESSSSKPPEKVHKATQTGSFQLTNTELQWVLSRVSNEAR